MHANELLKCRDKIIKAFKDDIFSSEHLKKPNDAAYNYMLENVNYFIEEIKSMKKKINLSLLEDFFKSSSPADYAKMLINADLKDRIEKMIKMRMRH